MTAVKKRKIVIQCLRTLFCVSLFLLCVMMVFFLDNQSISKKNRTLAAWPSFWVEDKFNEKFYEQYEAYLKDHFPHRYSLIKFYYNLQYTIQNRIENEKAFAGDNGCFFSFYSTRDNNIYIQNWEFDKLKEKNESFIKYVQKRPIDVYFFIVPSRVRIYQKYWDKYYANRRHISIGEEIKNTFSAYPNVEVFFPYNQLKKLSQKEDVFLKQDIHLYGKAGLQPLVDTFTKILQKRYFPDINDYSKVKHDTKIRYVEKSSNKIMLNLRDDFYKWPTKMVRRMTNVNVFKLF